MKQLLLKIASLIYGAAIRIRHAMFDWNMLHGKEFDIPVICVGNITVGGTGKTPAVEMLVNHFCRTYNVAVISRGYGRRTKGYREVFADDTYLDVGDEPLQIKRKFPDVVVAVCENRVDGIERMMEDYPSLNMVIMDDGFQHRYVKPFINIIMVDATRPVEHDNLLPYGQLRDTVSSLGRAHYFLVAKCPENGIKPIDANIMRKVLVQAPYQHIYFTGVKRCGVRPIFDDSGMTFDPRGKVIAMSGIGNNEAFNNGLRARYNVVDTLDFDDHHAYRIGDLKRIQKALDKHPDAVIFTTEKDAVKLAGSRNIPEDIRHRMFYESIEMSFHAGDKADFLQKLEKDINQRNNGTYIRGC